MDDADRLIERLLTLAGTIMEDVSAVAIVNTGAAGRAERIRAVRSAAADLAVLADAADVVSRRGLT